MTGVTQRTDRDTFGPELPRGSAGSVRPRTWVTVPDGILGRLRWTFLGFTILTIALSVSSLPASDLPVFPSLTLGVAAYALLVMWARWLYLVPQLPPLGHVGGPLLVLAAGVALQGDSTIGLVILATVGLHLLSVGRRVAVVMTATYFVVSQLTGMLVDGPLTMVVDARGAVAAVALGLIAVLLQFIREFASSHDRLIEREWVLNEVGSHLFAARELPDLHRATVTGASRLAAATTVSLWRGQGPLICVAARSGGRWLPDLEGCEVELPSTVLAAHQHGRPRVLEGERARETQERLGVPVHPTCTVVPLGTAKTTAGTLVIAHDDAPDEGVEDVVRRFAREASLALERMELTDEVGRRAELLRALIDNSSDTIMLLDAAQRVAFVSPSVVDVLGVDPQEIEGGSVTRLVDPRGLIELRSRLETSGGGAEHDAPFTCRMLDADGEWRHTEIAVSAVAGPGPAAHVLNVRDVTERRLLEEEINRRNFYDAVTGLANRSLLMDRLDHALERSQRSERLVGLIVVDLDDFKAVNANLGYVAGDTVLRAVAECLRSLQRPGDTVARLGGDEFGLLMDDLVSPAEAHGMVTDVLDALREPLHVAGHRLPIPASAGLVVSDSGETDPEALLRDAETALYAAKGSGKSHYQAFHASMSTLDLESLELRADIERGIREDEFGLSYQPIVDVRTGETVILEVLLRWRHPTRGSVPPDEFIPLAESSRLIVPLGGWVLQRACQDVARWNRERVDERRLMLSVNVSAVQLHDDGLADQVSSAVARAGLDPALVVLEITETALMSDTGATTDAIAALKELGVRIAIDDFGTGYSSLGYLNRFPVDLLKIDREFIAKVTEGPEEAAIANAIVKLADTLALEVVAEGVETPEQRDVLAEWGCDLAQGYLYAPPLPAGVLPGWLGTVGSWAVDTPEHRPPRSEPAGHNGAAPAWAPLLESGPRRAEH